MHEDRRLGRDDALLWLNDRLGSDVHASVFVSTEGHSHAVLGASGVIRHWRATAPPTAAFVGRIPQHDDELAGHYTVGDDNLMFVDVTELPEDAIVSIVSDGDELRVELAPEVWLSVAHATRTLPGSEDWTGSRRCPRCWAATFEVGRGALSRTTRDDGAEIEVCARCGDRESLYGNDSTAEPTFREWPLSPERLADEELRLIRSYQASEGEES